MSDAKKSMMVTKRDKEFHIDVNLNGQELYETLVALIYYPSGSYASVKCQGGKAFLPLPS